jgi:hypothetical protein
MTNDIRKFMNLMEDTAPALPRGDDGRAASPDIQYVSTPDKVVATLKSYDSQSYTKLAQKIERISELEKEAKALKEEVKQLGREKVADLFSADDVVRTRIVETCSFIFTLTKNPKATETYSYAKILGELESSLTPELIKVMESLKEKYKSVTNKEPALSIKPVATEESLNEGFWDELKAKFAKFAAAVSNWAGKYDSKLDSLKAQAALGESITALESNVDMRWAAPESKSPWQAFAEAKQDDRNECTECGAKIDSDDYHVCDKCGDKKDGEKSLEEQLVDEYGSSAYDKVGRDFQTKKTPYDQGIAQNHGTQKSMDEPALISTWQTHEGSKVYIWRAVQDGRETISMVNSAGKKLQWHREPKNYSDAVAMLKSDYEYQQVANQKELSLEDEDLEMGDDNQGLTEYEDAAESMYPVAATLDDAELEQYLNHWKIAKNHIRDSSSPETMALMQFGQELEDEARSREWQV